MIVTLIEKVYSFLWGDLVQIPLPGGSTGDFASNYIIDSRRNLFYNSDAFSADPVISGYGAGTGREETR